jgi:hypothetical protein
MCIMTRVFGWLYSQVLRLYPRQFRAEFGNEMLAVFAEAIHHDSGLHRLERFLREMVDLPAALVEAHMTSRLLRGDTSMRETPIVPLSKWQAFWGILPFLGFGAAYMLHKVDPIYGVRGHDAEMVVYALSLAGLLIGWIRCFPLWTYGYLGWAVVLANASTNGKFYGVRWGYQVWIPFGITVAIALLWTRSLQPIRTLVRDVWSDWTRLSLVMYAMGAWVVEMLGYDSNHHPYLLVYMLASTLVLAGATWFFLRSSSFRGRTLSIAAGSTIGLTLGLICSSTWDWQTYYGRPNETTTWATALWRMGLFLVLLGVFLFWPSVIGLLRRVALRRTA